MPFVRFMSSGTGRAVRVIAGLALIGIGLFAVGGTGGYVVAAVGLLPLAAGAFDFCTVAPLFGRPFSGAANRAADQAR